MQRFEITGMSCAACSAHVEKAVAAVPGVSAVAVSLLTNSMQVEYTAPADEAAICKAVEDAGYGAKPASDDAAAEESALEDTETPRLRRRLITSLCFLVPLMYISMGHMIGLPLPPFLEGDGFGALWFALVQLALTLPVCWINRAFFISGFKGLKNLAPGMDALVALGAGAALAYGVFALVMISTGLASGNADQVMEYRHDLYFESAAMILTLITVGKMLEAYSKGRTTDALKSLMRLAPQTARIVRDGRDRSPCRWPKSNPTTSSSSVPVRASRWTAWWWRASPASTRPPSPGRACRWTSTPATRSAPPPSTRTAP